MQFLIGKEKNLVLDIKRVNVTIGELPSEEMQVDSIAKEFKCKNKNERRNSFALLHSLNVNTLIFSPATIELVKTTVLLFMKIKFRFVVNKVLAPIDKEPIYNYKVSHSFLFLFV